MVWIRRDEQTKESQVKRSGLIPLRRDFWFVFVVVACQCEGIKESVRFFTSGHSCCGRSGRMSAEYCSSAAHYLAACPGRVLFCGCKVHFCCVLTAQITRFLSFPALEQGAFLLVTLEE